MSIFESLENLNVSEECFDDIMGIVEELISEVSNPLVNKVSNQRLHDADKAFWDEDEKFQKYAEARKEMRDEPGYKLGRANLAKVFDTMKARDEWKEAEKKKDETRAKYMKNQSLVDKRDKRKGLSESILKEIMGIVEELLEEGRKEGESDTDFKIRTADELSQKYKEKLGKAMAQKDGLEKKAEEMCHLSSKALNKSNASSKKYPSTPPRNTKAGNDLEKAIRCHNAHCKANDAVSDNLKEIKSLNKKIDKVSAIKNNAQIQKKQEK